MVLFDEITREELLDLLHVMILVLHSEYLLLVSSHYLCTRYQVKTWTKHEQNKQGKVRIKLYYDISNRWHPGRGARFMFRLSRQKIDMFRPYRPNFGMFQFSQPNFGMFRFFRPNFGMFRHSWPKLDMFRLSRHSGPKMGMLNCFDLYFRCARPLFRLCSTYV